MQRKSECVREAIENAEQENAEMKENIVLEARTHISY